MKKFFIMLFAVVGFAVTANAQVLEGTSCMTDKGKEGELRVTSGRSIETKSTSSSVSKDKDSGGWTASGSIGGKASSIGTVEGSAGIGGGYTSGKSSNSAAVSNNNTSSVEYEYDCFPKEKEESSR